MRILASALAAGALVWMLVIAIRARRVTPETMWWTLFSVGTIGWASPRPTISNLGFGLFCAGALGLFVQGRKRARTTGASNEGH